MKVTLYNISDCLNREKGYLPKQMRGGLREYKSFKEKMFANNEEQRLRRKKEYSKLIIE